MQGGRSLGGAPYRQHRVRRVEPVRHWFPLSRDGVARRERILIAQEDAAILAARDRATTDEERTFLDGLIEERDRNRRRLEQ